MSLTTFAPSPLREEDEGEVIGKFNN